MCALYTSVNPACPRLKQQWSADNYPQHCKALDAQQSKHFTTTIHWWALLSDEDLPCELVHSVKPRHYMILTSPKSPQLGFTQIGFCRTVKSRPWQVAKSGSQLSVHFRWKVETNASQILVNATLPWQQIFVLGVFSHITEIKILKRCCCLLELYWCIKSSQRV